MIIEMLFTGSVLAQGIFAVLTLGKTLHANFPSEPLQFYQSRWPSLTEHLQTEPKNSKTNTVQLISKMNQANTIKYVLLYKHIADNKLRNVVATACTLLFSSSVNKLFEYAFSWTFLKVNFEIFQKTFFLGVFYSRAAVEFSSNWFFAKTIKNRPDNELKVCVGLSYVLISIKITESACIRDSSRSVRKYSACIVQMSTAFSYFLAFDAKALKKIAIAKYRSCKAKRTGSASPPRFCHFEQLFNALRIDFQ